MTVVDYTAAGGGYLATACAFPDWRAFGAAVLECLAAWCDAHCAKGPALRRKLCRCEDPDLNGVAPVWVALCSSPAGDGEPALWPVRAGTPGAVPGWAVGWDVAWCHWAWRAVAS